MQYRFDDFEIDTEQFTLRNSGGVVHLEPLVFGLLCYLVQHCADVVSCDAMIEYVWMG